MWTLYAVIFIFVILILFLPVSFGTKHNIDVIMGKTNTAIMKGVAILCVVFCHYMGKFGDGITFFTPLGGIGVAIFLVLSGYGLSESWNRGGVSRLVEKKNYHDDSSVCRSSNDCILAPPWISIQ
jgi:hypothetical protein